MDVNWVAAAGLLVAPSIVAAAGFAYASRRAPNAVGVGEDAVRAAIAQLSATLTEERAAMRRDFAAALEEASAIGETVSRHRSKVEAAERRRAQREEREQPQVPMTVMDVARAARAAGKL